MNVPVRPTPSLSGGREGGEREGGREGGRREEGRRERGRKGESSKLTLKMCETVLD